MAFSAADVKNLREMTGVGMMDCKKALTAADGDIDKAVEWLREKGLAAAQKKAGRIAVLVNLETESTDAAVVELGKDIAMQIAALNPTYKDKSDGSEEFIEKEKEIRLAQAKEDPKNAKKPDAIIEKIVMGGIGKYFKEICLLQQPFVKDDKVSVEEHIAAVAKQVGASIKLVNYTRFEKGEGIEKRQDDLAAEVAKMVNG